MFWSNVLLPSSGCKKKPSVKKWFRYMGMEARMSEEATWVERAKYSFRIYQTA
jgi:hypothetical protein